MWEVLSFADKPYKGLTKAKVVDDGDKYAGCEGDGVGDEHVEHIWDSDHVRGLELS